MASIAKRSDGRWRARYRDAADREHSKHFPRRVDARRCLDGVAASVQTGSYVDPKTARTTVEQWCATWLEGYATRRPSTVRQLIASGADVKVVQARLRHASATTTLNTYAHLWPDADESTRAAVGAVLAARQERRQIAT